MDILFNFVGTACVLIWPYLYCHYASFVFDRISNMRNVAYDLNWYEFPLKLRKHFILIIARSQTSTNFTGLGLIDCTSENFGKVKFEKFSFRSLDLLKFPFDCFVLALQLGLFWLPHFQGIISEWILKSGVKVWMALLCIFLNLSNKSCLKQK